MNELSLFSGAGGGLLGSKLLGWHTVGYVEFNDYCQRVLAQRIRDGILDNAPIFGDIRTFLSSGCAELYKGVTDIVTGGFPCQDISSCKRDAKGLDGEKSGLWYAMSECISVIRPKYAFIENSPMLTIRGLERILCDLAAMGYDAKWCCLGGGHLYAPIKRDRLWILGVNNSIYGAGSQTVHQRADLKRYFWCAEPQDNLSNVETSWLISHGYGVREIDDVDQWVERAETIGNGQIPAVFAAAWEILNSE